MVMRGDMKSCLPIMLASYYDDIRLSPNVRLVVLEGLSHGAYGQGRRRPPAGPARHSPEDIRYGLGLAFSAAAAAGFATGLGIQKSASGPATSLET